MPLPHLCGLRVRALSAAALLAFAAAAGAQNCPNVNDLLLINGRIHTMAAPPNTDEVVFESVRIVGDRIDALGAPGADDPGQTACTEVIDLNGRTVIPGSGLSTQISDVLFLAE
jgi:hypothetical protein